MIEIWFTKERGLTGWKKRDVSEPTIGFLKRKLSPKWQLLKSTCDLKSKACAFLLNSNLSVQIIFFFI